MDTGGVDGCRASLPRHGLQQWLGQPSPALGLWRLSQAEFTAPRTGFFPSLRATLNHILVIDRFYIDAMEGGTLGPAAWANREPCETAILLREAQREMDRRLIAVVEQLVGPISTGSST